MRKSFVTVFPLLSYVKTNTTYLLVFSTYCSPPDHLKIVGQDTHLLCTFICVCMYWNSIYKKCIYHNRVLIVYDILYVVTIFKVYRLLKRVLCKIQKTDWVSTSVKYQRLIICPHRDCIYNRLYKRIKLLIVFSLCCFCIQSCNNSLKEQFSPSSKLVTLWYKRVKKHKTCYITDVFVLQ